FLIASDNAPQALHFRCLDGCHGNRSALNIGIYAEAIGLGVMEVVLSSPPSATPAEHEIKQPHAQDVILFGTLKNLIVRGFVSEEAELAKNECRRQSQEYRPPAAPDQHNGSDQRSQDGCVN